MQTASPPPSILLLATMATKTEEATYFAARLTERGVQVDTLDISLQTDGISLNGREKIAAMEASVQVAVQQITLRVGSGINAVAGIGGGTGGEIILRALKALPMTFPKLLISTLAFDPRIAVADNSIVLVPTLSDICGLNATLREVLENAAAMTAGLCTMQRQSVSCVETPSVGITSLGVTEKAVLPILDVARARGHETTVFHANGYGGAAFARFADRGAFHTIIDLTPHEMTRLLVAGAHVDMPNRFIAAPDLPRIVLPGGLNFVGLGEIGLVPQRFLERPHYEHSGLFTHAKLLPDEMERVATQLATDLNACTGLRTMIVPMGGFSSQDRPGGMIEDCALRGVFLESVRANLSDDVTLIVLDDHLFDPKVTAEVARSFDCLNTQRQDHHNA